MNREQSLKNLETADAYILITVKNGDMCVDRMIGDSGFTFIGGVEFVKQDLLVAFKDEAKKIISDIT